MTTEELERRAMAVEHLLLKIARVREILHDHLDNAAGDSSWVKEALEILEGKK